MPRVSLLGGSYTSASLIADVQRCLNLYPEAAPQESETPTPVAHLPRPGLLDLYQFPDQAEVRGLYVAFTGDLFAVCGSSVYWCPMTNGQISPQKLGTIGSSKGRVAMQDNGVDLLIGDGTPNGYMVDITSTPFMTSFDPNGANAGPNGPGWQGATYLDYLDTFIVASVPNSAQWNASLSNVMQFDALYIASKTAFPDKLMGLAVVDRYIWLIGTVTTEIWFNAGGALFPFAILSGPFIQYGCCAVDSITRIAEGVAWLGNSREGKAIALLGEQYHATRISNHAVETEWQKYPTVSDARGFRFQLGGHTFFGLNFPTADKTWLWDKTTNQWHEASTGGTDQVQHRWLVQCAANAYGMVVGGDYANGNLYQITPDQHTDNGIPILRLRSFPHIVGDDERKVFHRFIADIETGNVGGDLGLSDNPGAPEIDLFGDPTGFQILTDPGDPTTGGRPLEITPGVAPFNPMGAFSTQPPVIYLQWSDDRGKTYGEAVPQTLGATGEFRTSVQWTRLGQTRDRVYRLYWNTNTKISLQGAFIAPPQSGRS